MTESRNYDCPTCAAAPGQFCSELPGVYLTELPEGSSPWIHDLRGVLMEYNHRIDNAAANGDFILL